ncbi:hypothetical protein [Ramlibacter sp. WS9]|uniref:hypothetical protein n=1 Tax=Ramlibacter sp. WS9 TaxID=1882741 RepID=UPI001143E17A|nr:hypothetical protein [Ramlibacter sp. WS9]
MTSTVPSEQPRTALPPPDSQAEAARYALLRRLAPSMRHHLVVNLQPIGMIYEVMDRRLRAAEPDLAEVHDSAHKINGFARAALASCLDVVTWLAPEEEALITAADGVRECFSLVATSLTFRGYALRNEVPAVSGQVRRSAVRNVLTAALLHATDENPAPADLVLTTEPDAGALVLALTLRPTDGDKGFSPEPPYRALRWSDVEALAAAESVALSREGRQKMRLSIPWTRAAAA